MQPCGWKCSCDASRKIFHSPSNHSFLLIWCSCTSLLWSETYVPYVWPFLLHDFSCLSGESVLSLVTGRDIRHRRTRTSDSRYRHTSIIVAHITCLLAIRLTLLFPVASIAWVKFFHCFSSSLKLPLWWFLGYQLDTDSQYQLNLALTIFDLEFQSKLRQEMSVRYWFMKAGALTHSLYRHRHHAW